MKYSLNCKVKGPLHHSANVISIIVKVLEADLEALVSYNQSVKTFIVKVFGRMDGKLFRQVFKRESYVINYAIRFFDSHFSTTVIFSDKKVFFVRLLN